MNKKVRISVEKQGSENSASVLRRFTRKVSGSGVLRTARGSRYQARPQSDFQKKSGALRRIKKSAERKKQMKLGKVIAKKGRRR